MFFSLWQQNVYEDPTDYLLKLNQNLNTTELKNMVTGFTNQNISSEDCVFLNKTINDNFIKGIIAPIYKAVNGRYYIDYDDKNTNYPYKILTVDEKNISIIQIPYYDNQTKGFTTYANIIIFNPYYILFNTDSSAWTNNKNKIDSLLNDNGAFTNAISQASCKNYKQLLIRFFQPDNEQALQYSQDGLITSTDNNCYYILWDHDSVGNRITSTDYRFEIYCATDGLVQYPDQCSFSFNLQVVPSNAFKGVVINDNTVLFHKLTDYNISNQDCFNFTNVKENNIFSRGITCNGCTFPDYTQQGYGQLDSMIRSGITDFTKIPDYVSAKSLVYYDDNGSKQLTSNNNYTFNNNNSTNPSLSDTNATYNNQEDQNNNIITRTITFGGNGTNDSNLYAKRGDNDYISFNDITNSLSLANDLAANKLKGVIGITTNDGTIDNTLLYGYIDTTFGVTGPSFVTNSSDPATLKDQNYLITDPGYTNIPTLMRDIYYNTDQTPNKDKYQFVNQNNLRSGDYKYSTATSWNHNTSVQGNPFVYDSSFITLIDKTTDGGKKYCNNLGGVTIPDGSSFSSTNIFTNPDDLKNQLWTCKPCPDGSSGIPDNDYGPCQKPPSEYWCQNYTSGENADYRVSIQKGNCDPNSGWNDFSPQQVYTSGSSIDNQLFGSILPKIGTTGNGSCLNWSAASATTSNGTNLLTKIPNQNNWYCLNNNVLLDQSSAGYNCEDYTSALGNLGLSPPGYMSEKCWKNDGTSTNPDFTNRNSSVISSNVGSYISFKNGESSITISYIIKNYSGTSQSISLDHGLLTGIVISPILEPYATGICSTPELPWATGVNNTDWNTGNYPNTWCITASTPFVENTDITQSNPVANPSFYLELNINSNYFRIINDSSIPYTNNNNSIDPIVGGCLYDNNYATHINDLKLDPNSSNTYKLTFVKDTIYCGSKTTAQYRTGGTDLRFNFSYIGVNMWISNFYLDFKLSDLLNGFVNLHK
jgi:hypothetical protein